MKPTRIVLVTGLPASGKTTLARELARRHGVPLLAKDLIKEPLLDVLGAGDAAASRKLSDASFAVLFAVARELIESSGELVLEGNFRPGEHEAPLRALLAPHARVAQILCRAPADVRRARLVARSADPSRHSGHRDAELVGGAAAADAFLELPGARFEWTEGTPPEALDRWWRER